PVTLYDRNGRDIGPISNNVGRWVSYAEISPFVSRALIAAEDESFLKHEGVYLGSLVRMAYNMKASESSVTGGSTLTMQLLKNLYFNSWEDNETIFKD